jgi:hypothetical protein
MKHVIQHQIGSQDALPISIHAFQLTEDIEWLIFHVQPERKCWFMMSVWDPEKVLRAQFFYGQAPNTIVLHKEPGLASSLTLPGHFPQGEWMIEIVGTDTVFTEGTQKGIAFTLEWETGSGNLPDFLTVHMLGTDLWAHREQQSAGFVFNQFDWDRLVNSEKRWYKGDFHTHTILSDGKLTPEEGMKQAEKMGLDFFVATDHNVISTGWAGGGSLVIPGVEITSSKGHFNALGPRKWIDYRISSPDGGMETEAGMNRVLAETNQAGALRSVNHPQLVPWQWQFRDTLLGEIDVLEIWNDPTFPKNPQATEEALKVWDTLWNEGYRIWGIGGSDAHLRPDESYTPNGEPSVIGDPGTFVYSDGLSAAKILKSVSQGRVYVSRGPLLDLTVQAGEQLFSVGSDLTEAWNGGQDHRVSWKVTITNVSEPGQLRWIELGKEVLVQELHGNGQYGASFDWNGRDYVWLRLEIRKAGGDLLAFTNPIYYGKQEPSVSTWGQLLEKAGC